MFSEPISGKGDLFIVSGPSGSGKTSLCQFALDSLDNISFSISYTTRRPREKERHGVDYFFISMEEFEEMRSNNFFLEWAVVHGNSYGTGMDYVQNHLGKGEDILLDIDVQGAQQVRRRVREAISILIFPPNHRVLYERLKNRRSDTDEVITKRLQGARNELARFSEYDYLIVNDDFRQATQELIAILSACRCRTERRRNQVNSILECFPMSEEK
jgi:guanylate kinase